MRVLRRPAPAPSLPALLRDPVALLALLAVLVPVVALLWAGQAARDAVGSRVRSGQRSAAGDAAARAGAGWAGALEQARAAARHPDVVDALLHPDPAALASVADRLPAGTALVGLALYDGSGALVAGRGAPWSRPDRPVAEQVGAAEATPGDTTVEVVSPVLARARRVGTLRVVVSLRRALPGLPGRTGRTGTTSLVGPTGALLLTPGELPAGPPASRRLVVARVPAQTTEGTLLTSYAPVPGTGWGVVVREDTGEAFAGADRVGRRLLLAAGLLLGGGLLALRAGAAVLRRSRLATDERDEAVSARRSTSALLATTSHEIRTPLSGMLGLTEVLLGTGLDAAQREYARTVQRSGEGLLRLLDDLLDLAKVEAGRLDVERLPFCLAAVVEQAVAPFRPLAAGRGVGLEVAVDPALPGWVLGDPARLGQVLGNLVSNAVKFTAAGAVRVEVTGSDVVEVRVGDTGAGIADDVLPRLFSAFTQGDAGTARTYGGTGLGLAVSRQLAELQGGTLSATSVLGQGSVFTLVLPLPAADAPPVPAELAVDPGPALSVLVVDDDRVSRLVARLLLEQLGHRVDTATDGAAAVEAVLAGAYDVVLMDGQLPVLDGCAATEAIRAAQAGGARTAVLGLSASATEADRARCLAAGMDGSLTKPVLLRELAEALRTVTSVTAG